MRSHSTSSRNFLLCSNDPVPTIYADGIHDDSAGWAAAVRNERVMYDGKVYEPDENMTIDREMHFAVNVCALGEEFDIPPEVDETWIVARTPITSRREIYFLEDCDHDAQRGDDCNR